MKNRIIWSTNAKEDFEKNLISLLEDWDKNVIFEFTEETARILKTISISPKTFQRHAKNNVHKVPITKHITLFYRIQKEKVELLRFWNNYKNPKDISFDK